MNRHYPSCNPHHSLPVDAVSGENDSHNYVNNTTKLYYTDLKKKKIACRNYTGYNELKNEFKTFSED